MAIFSYILAALFAERHLAEEKLKTLTSELQHRTNNLLTVVQMIANRTLSGNDPLTEKEILEARLRALARANQQLTELDWNGLTLGEIIRSELESYLARCEIEGTDIVLDRQYAQNFSLVLHELATNAIKCGALSNGKDEFTLPRVSKATAGTASCSSIGASREGHPLPPPSGKDLTQSC